MKTRRLSLKGAGAAVFLGALAACSVIRYTPGEGEISAAAGSLASEDEATRESGRDILERGRSRSVPALAKLMADPDENLRYRALAILSRIGPDAAGAVPDLVRMLKDPANPFPSSTAAALARTGPAATGPVAGLLAEEDEGTRYWAVGALAGLAREDRKALVPLVTALGDDSPAVRARASDALAAAGNAAVPALAAAAEGGEPDTAAEALETLRRMDGRDAVAAVARLGKPEEAPSEPASEPVLEEEPGLSATATGAESGLPVVAVADLGAEGVSRSDAAVASDWLRNELVATGKLTVVERSRMEQVLTEQALQRTGCTREDCAVKLGRLLNVRRMVVGSFGKLLGSYVVTVRVVDVESGVVVYGATGRGKTEEEIGAAIRKMAGMIAEKK